MLNCRFNYYNIHKMHKVRRYGYTAVDQERSIHRSTGLSSRFSPNAKELNFMCQVCYGGPPGKPGGKCSLGIRTDRWSAGHWGRSQVKAWLDLAWLTILPITHLVHDKVALSKDSANVLTSGGLHWAAVGGREKR